MRPLSTRPKPRLLKLAVAALLVIAFLPVVPASATPVGMPQVYVNAVTGDDTDGTGTALKPYKSITKGLDRVSLPGTVYVAPGTYGASETNETYPIEIYGGTELRGAGSDLVTIVGEGLTGALEAQAGGGGGIHIMGFGSCSLSGFTITGGSQYAGGGLYSAGGNAEFEDIVFYRNDAQYGAGAYLSGTTATFTACAFVDNGTPQQNPELEAQVDVDYNIAGAGLYAMTSDVTMIECEFDGNAASNGGGGIFSADSTFDIEGTCFEGNTVLNQRAFGLEAAEDGRVGYGDGPALGLSAQNLAPAIGGGAIEAAGSNVDIDDCSFYGNEGTDSDVLGTTSQIHIYDSALGGGEGMGVVGDWGSMLTQLQEAPPQGPATQASVAADLTASATTIERCTVTCANAQALVHSENTAQMTVVNSLLAHNLTKFAGAVGGESSDSIASPQLDLFNTTIADNEGWYYPVDPNLTASVLTDDLPEPPTLPDPVLGESAGLASFGNGGGYVTNSIVWQADEMPLSPQLGGPGAQYIDMRPSVDDGFEVDYSDLKRISVETDAQAPGLVDLGTCISEDPHFVAPLNGDYHLTAASPCIDTGQPLQQAMDDLDGLSRPVDGDEDGNDDWDMGCYEFSPYDSDRIAGADRYATAVETSKQHFLSADTVVIATGRTFADGLSASGLAGMYEAPLLLTGSTWLPAAVKDEIVRLGATRVILVGGTNAVSGGVADQLANMGLDVERIGGADRYETSLLITVRLISELETGWAGPLFIARGDTYPDALAVSPVAYGNTSPVILVEPDALPRGVVDIVDQLGGSTIVVGGEAAVSQGVAGQLAAADRLTRIGGADRYETAALIAEFAYANGYATFGTTGIATGRDFADALSGGAGIGLMDGVLLLNPKTTVSPYCEAAVVAHDTEILTLSMFGGNNAVSQPVADHYFGLLP